MISTAVSLSSDDECSSRHGQWCWSISSAAFLRLHLLLPALVAAAKIKVSHSSKQLFLNLPVLVLLMWTGVILSPGLLTRSPGVAGRLCFISDVVAHQQLRPGRVVDEVVERSRGCGVRNADVVTTFTWLHRQNLNQWWMFLIFTRFSP